MNKEIEYITIMELDVPFTRKELKDNYRNLCRLYHPDMHATESQDKIANYEEIMKKINEAHDYLQQNFDILKTNNASSSKMHKEVKEAYQKRENVKKDYAERKNYKNKIENLCKSINLTLTEAGDLYSKLVSNNSFNGNFEKWLNKRVTEVAREKENESYNYILQFYYTLKIYNFFNMDRFLNMYLTEKELTGVDIDIYSFLMLIEEKIKILLKSAKENAEFGSVYDLKTDPSKLLLSIKQELDEAFYEFYLSNEINSILAVLEKEINLYKMSTILKCDLRTIRQRLEVDIQSMSLEEFLTKAVELQELSNNLKIDKNSAKAFYQKYVDETGFEGGYIDFLNDLKAIYNIESQKTLLNIPDDLETLMKRLIIKRLAFVNCSETERKLGFYEWLNQEQLLIKYNCSSYRELFALIQNNLGEIPLTDVIDSLMEGSYQASSTKK